MACWAWPRRVSPLLVRACVRWAGALCGGVAACLGLASPGEPAFRLRLLSGWFPGWARRPVGCPAGPGLPWCATSPACSEGVVLPRHCDSPAAAPRASRRLCLICSGVPPAPTGTPPTHRGPLPAHPQRRSARRGARGARRAARPRPRPASTRSAAAAAARVRAVALAARPRLPLPCAARAGQRLPSWLTAHCSTHAPLLLPLSCVYHLCSRQRRERAAQRGRRRAAGRRQHHRRRRRRGRRQRKLVRLHWRLVRLGG